jgi:hypothetical protein
MSTESIQSIAVSSFYSFVQDTPSSAFAERDLQSLAGYIAKWVRAGHGVHDCQGDFQTFLIAVISIIDCWHREPGLLDYAPQDEESTRGIPPVQEHRTVDRIFYTDGETDDPAILDPHFYQGQVYATLHPEVDTWWKYEPAR